MLLLSSMEEKREIIYSDISSASRKQPYDAMAIKKPDNSAGTTQTVYWRAEV